MNENLRAWLQQEINRQGWSQREFGRQASLSQSVVNGVLAGERNPTADFCVKAAQAFDVAPEMVLRLAGILPDEPDTSELAHSPIAQEVLQLIHNMPPEQRKEALRYIRYLSQPADSSDI